MGRTRSKVYLDDQLQHKLLKNYQSDQRAVGKTHPRLFVNNQVSLSFGTSTSAMTFRPRIIFHSKL